MRARHFTAATMTPEIGREVTTMLECQRSRAHELIEVADEKEQPVTGAAAAGNELTAVHGGTDTGRGLVAEVRGSFVRGQRSMPETIIAAVHDAVSETKAPAASWRSWQRARAAAGGSPSPLVDVRVTLRRATQR